MKAVLADQKDRRWQQAASEGTMAEAGKDKGGKGIRTHES
jgi:hypothetical protein